MNPTGAAEPSPKMTQDEVPTELFTHAMTGRWEEVVKIHKRLPKAHEIKITKSGDTALHLAISDGQAHIVEQLVSIVHNNSGDLAVKNEHENTPLHLAAIQENVEMCECIASKDKKLIGKRNKDTETPFFLAVLHGKKDAFLRLNEYCENDRHNYGRRNDNGETILHAAIFGEYFDIAFEIINGYDDHFVNAVNRDGLTALHILANRPSAFESGSQISGWRKLIYHCTFVDELQQRKSVRRSHSQAFRYDAGAIYPENYQTCMNFGVLLRKIVAMLLAKRSDQPDAENPEGQQENNKQDDSTKSGKNQQLDAKGKQSDDKGTAQGHKFFPDNYLTCFHGLKILSKTMLVILGLGSKEIVRIQEKKEKHTWSIQIMERLLKKTSGYKYEDGGRRPSDLQEKTGETTPYVLSDSGIVDFSQSWLENGGSSSGPTQSEEEGATSPYAPSNDGADSPKSEISVIITHDDHNLQPPTNDPSEANQDKTAEGSGGTPGNGHTKKRVGKKETPILIAAKDGASEMVETILQCFPEMKLSYPAGKSRNDWELDKKETPILLAAKNGVLEMVETILHRFPVAINDVNYEKKNILLLAVENRQPHVYKFLLHHKMKETLFRQRDIKGNSALHLAATQGKSRPWRIPGAALQMQWEFKWYKFVKDAEAHSFVRYNNDGRTPREIFTESHKDLVKEGGEWLTNTSESCSVVAALIATVAFATSSAVPGGVKEETGAPSLEHHPTFSLFAISSLVALCCSVTSLVMFLAILTSRYEEKNFGKGLPRTLLVGMSSLFVSIASILVSFCAGHFFVLKHELHYAALPMYAVTCLPVTFYAIAQLPLYIDLVQATFAKEPQRRYK